MSPPADRPALDRLRCIRREPKDVFNRQVGSLLAEFRSRLCPWNAAALRLLDDAYTSPPSTWAASTFSRTWA